MKTRNVLPSAGLLLLLASCAAPKAVIVEEETPERPVEKKRVVVAPKPVEPAPMQEETVLRLGDDMLAMPDDSRLRSISREVPSNSPVIARPPTE